MNVIGWSGAGEVKIKQCIVYERMIFGVKMNLDNVYLIIKITIRVLTEILKITDYELECCAVR
jgi:hypothetical protein